MTETVMPPELLAGIKVSPTRSRVEVFADSYAIAGIRRAPGRGANTP